MKLGAVAVPLDPRLTEPELERRLERAQATVVCATRSSSRMRGRGRPSRSTDDRARRRPLRDSHLGDRGSAEAGRADLRQPALERARLGRADRRRPRRTAGSAAWRCTTSAGWRSCCEARSTAPAVVLERFEATAVARLIADERITLASLVGDDARRGCSTRAPSSIAFAACCSAEGRWRRRPSSARSTPGFRSPRPTGSPRRPRR